MNSDHIAMLPPVEVAPGAVAILPNGDYALADKCGHVVVRASLRRFLLAEGWRDVPADKEHDLEAATEKALDRRRLDLMKSAMRRPIRDIAALGGAPRVNLNKILRATARD